MLDEWLTDLKQNAQKTMITWTVANAAEVKSLVNKNLREKTTTETLQLTRESALRLTEDMDTAMKGKFAKQAMETMRKQSGKLGNL